VRLSGRPDTRRRLGSSFVDASGIAALITAVSSAIVGVGSYVSGHRKDKNRKAKAAVDTGTDGTDPFTALERYHEIFEDFEVDRARMSRELREERAAHDVTRDERDRYRTERDEMRWRLAKYEAVENHDDDPTATPTSRLGDDDDALGP
jgi:hypothetical protein